MSSTPRTDPSERADALGGERPVERGSFRDRIRSKPGIGHTWRVGVFLLGLVCILGGFALAVLPGPLTIPPVLLGLWLWSTEFEWAHRFFRPFKKKGEEAWEHAKRHPVSSTHLHGARTGAGRRRDLGDQPLPPRRPRQRPRRAGLTRLMAYVDRHAVLVDATPDRVWAGVTSLGGDPRFYAPRVLWQVRGLADGLARRSRLADHRPGPTPRGG